jgi:prepilin-type N-terminal cleavage/methylation domain-containing protein
MLQKFRNDTKGFTLIELMIVIAIIGILAAIAIPNFIAYRNKAFCSAAESDAKSIAADIADYFAIPAHTNIVTADVTYNASGTNTFTITTADPSENITITVTDGSGRCPDDYQTASSGWDGSNVFTEIMQE